MRTMYATQTKPSYEDHSAIENTNRTHRIVRNAVLRAALTLEEQSNPSKNAKASSNANQRRNQHNENNPRSEQKRFWKNKNWQQNNAANDSDNRKSPAKVWNKAHALSAESKAESAESTEEQPKALVPSYGEIVYALCEAHAHSSSQSTDSSAEPTSESQNMCASKDNDLDAVLQQLSAERAEAQTTAGTATPSVAPPETTAKLSSSPSRSSAVDSIPDFSEPLEKVPAQEVHSIADVYPRATAETKRVVALFEKMEKGKTVRLPKTSWALEHPDQPAQRQKDDKQKNLQLLYSKRALFLNDPVYRLRLLLLANLGI